jgi:hypothetical protein
MLTFLQLGRYGRIGNQMFQIASTIGIANRHGYDYAFPRWLNHDQLVRFGTTSEDLNVQAVFQHRLPVLTIGPEYFRTVEVPWGYHDLQLGPEHINLAGHMQSERYFVHCKDLIRHYFTFRPDFEGRVWPPVAALWPAEPDQGKVCGIHLRRGDYVKEAAYHINVGIDYYEKAMGYFDGDTRFVVFSDEPEKAKDMFGVSDRFFYSEGRTPMEDLLLMSYCDHFITSNSTLCWWGAWLIENPEKRIFIPSTWFGAAAGGINGLDLVCPNWTLI